MHGAASQYRKAKKKTLSIGVTSEKISKFSQLSGIFQPPHMEKGLRHTRKSSEVIATWAIIQNDQIMTLLDQLFNWASTNVPAVHSWAVLANCTDKF